MRYQVEMLVDVDGREDVQAVEYVQAPNVGEAKYRAALALENRGRAIVRRVVAVRKA